jgi:triphosphoribosyl-dephospho-CoA synthetase
VDRFAWAPNSLAALALVRAGRDNGWRQPLGEVLDSLPMDTLSAVRPHRLTLAHIGCRTLGDAPAVCGFALVSDGDLAFDAGAMDKSVRTEAGRAVLRAFAEALAEHRAEVNRDRVNHKDEIRLLHEKIDHLPEKILNLLKGYRLQ